MDYTVIKRVPDSKDILLAVSKNDGYCPCKVEKTPDTKCMCKEFRDQKRGVCSCGLYNKVDADFLIYTKEGCTRCAILKRELARAGKIFVETDDYATLGDDEYFMDNGLPVLVTPTGRRYNYPNAIKLMQKITGYDISSGLAYEA